MRTLLERVRDKVKEDPRGHVTWAGLLDLLEEAVLWDEELRWEQSMGEDL